jgi:cephalosporin-C deacetylase-like acetyl esterase
MTEPDDFGLSPIQTLAHIGDLARAPSHGAFWKNWSAAVFATHPRLAERRQEDPSDPSASHEFESVRHARIGCLLLWPPDNRPRGGILVLHGYENTPHLAESGEEWRELAERGLAVLVLRVRGYPGSQLDVAPLVAYAGPAGGNAWITYGLDDPVSDRGLGCAWAYSEAVADVVNAYRALRHHLSRGRGGHSLPIAICGESFGGGLAIAAASALAETDEPARLAIGLPSMGDWPWRLTLPEHVVGGAGGIIRRHVPGPPERERHITELLRLHDTVLHARRVRCPVLCKLALRDDVVPAPSAAAIFNALATAPGLKQRYVTQYGHFDGGIRDLRRHAAFERLAHNFLDPEQDPLEIVQAQEFAHAR